MKGQAQQLLLLDSRVLDDDRLEFGHGECLRGVSEDGVQHGHEVRFTGTERPVEKCRLVLSGAQPLVDHPEATSNASANAGVTT